MLIPKLNFNKNYRSLCWEGTSEGISGVLRINTDSPLALAMKIVVAKSVGIICAFIIRELLQVFGGPTFGSNMTGALV